MTGEEPFPGSPDDMMQTIASLRAQLEEARAQVYRDSEAMQIIHEAAALLGKRSVHDLRAQLEAAKAALEQWRKELCSLCEDTEERCAEDAKDLEGKEGAYARGRIREAKGIRRAMGEVIYEDLAALKKFPADEPPVGDQANAAPIKGDNNAEEILANLDAFNRAFKRR